MSAGSGVQHSEFNHAKDQATHFLQIWIQPDVTGITPSYEQKTFPESAKRGRLQLVASPDGAEGSVLIHANARVYAGLFDGSERFSLALAPVRKGYVHVVRGEVEVNGKRLAAGDAAKLENESQLALSAGNNAEVLVFDLES
jgi:redox-sensitive bicupin YhaK (pirin superfamily)